MLVCTWYKVYTRNVNENLANLEPRIANDRFLVFLSDLSWFCIHPHEIPARGVYDAGASWLAAVLLLSLLNFKYGQGFPLALRGRKKNVPVMDARVSQVLSCSVNITNQPDPTVIQHDRDRSWRTGFTYAHNSSTSTYVTPSSTDVPGIA